MISQHHEDKVKELVAEGLTPLEARREARAERQELRIQEEELRRNTRKNQANVRTGILLFKTLSKLLK